MTVILKKTLLVNINDLGDKMKKLIPILFVFFLIYGLTNKSDILIPSYAIRFRIIASSNSDIDQETKITIKNDLEPN